MKKIIVLALVLLMTGCSTKFVYKNFDWLVYWYVDDFVQLSAEQEKVFDEKLTQWLVWHKNAELPQYLAHLQELSVDIKSQQISLDRMDYHQEKAASHWVRLKTKIIPDLVEMSLMLSTEQVTSMFDEIAEINKDDAKEAAERLAMPPEKRKKQAIKRNKKNLKRWLGPLNNEQEQLVENMYGEYHSNAELWAEYRVRYQAELRSLFESSDRGPAFQSKLTQMLMEPQMYRSELLNQRNLENGNKYKEFLSVVDALATEKQRNHLVDEIAEFTEDLTDLLK